MRVADYIWHYLFGRGLRHVFMVAGGGAMHLVDALGKNKELTYVCNLHEQGASIAAEAYAQVAGIGCCLVTTGPGGTNAITGCASAWLESLPVVFISGQVKRSDSIGRSNLRQSGFQELNIVEMVKGITKYAVTVNFADEIRYHMDRALFEATHGRQGPVWLDIPLDIQATEVKTEEMSGYIPDYMPKPMLTGVDAVIDKLNNAKRPVILAGNGIRLSGGMSAFKELINSLKIPVLTTWKMVDAIPHDHNWYMGRPGAVASRYANFCLQNADLVISIGARLDLGQTGYNRSNFAKKAELIVVDIDKHELDKIERSCTRIHADALDFITGMLERRSWIKHKEHRADWWQRCRRWWNKYQIDTKGEVYDLVNKISDTVRSGDIVVASSSGAASEVLCQAFRSKDGVRFLNSPSLGAMGFTVPAAIGACLASGKSRVIAVDGDGSFAMNTQELEIISAENLPIKLFVLLNDGYGSIRATQDAHFDSNYVGCGVDSGLTLPCVYDIADASDIRTTLMHLVCDFFDDAMNGDDPCICGVTVENHITAPRIQSRKLPDGKMESSPLEDMCPLIDRKELADEMQDL
jgi:acetolactate synthase-1/2/3 large subunit